MLSVGLHAACLPICLCFFLSVCVSVCFSSPTLSFSTLTCLPFSLFPTIYLLVFFLLQVVRSLTEAADKWPYMIYLWAFFHWLAMSHTCYNPVILCWMNNKFRSGFCALAYNFPCLRRLVDQCYFTTHQRDDIDTIFLNNFNTPTSTTTCLHHCNHNNYATARTSRLVTISLKDDTIIFKSRMNNNYGQKGNPGGMYSCRKFLRMMEETSSQSPL